jgi:CheY-like chemotaxis protein
MPKKILLADDSITIQKVVELTFSDGDYEVVATNNGAKAIQRLAEVRPDIILSDIIMPEKNGYEVCEYVKSHPEFRHIPVILLTGTFEPFDPDRAEKAGCDAVVTKPFESQSLIHKVEELIAQSASRSPESPAAAVEDAFATGAMPAAATPFEDAHTAPTYEMPALSNDFAPAGEPMFGDSPFSSSPASSSSSASTPSASTDASPFESPSTPFDNEAASPFQAPAPAPAFQEHSADVFGSSEPTRESSGLPLTSNFPSWETGTQSPAPASSSSSSWESENSGGDDPGVTKMIPKLTLEELQQSQPAETPSAEPAPTSSFFSDADAEESGETKMIPKVTFDDLQRMRAEEPVEAAEPEESLEGEGLGETKMMPKLSFDEIQQRIVEEANALGATAEPAEEEAEVLPFGSSAAEEPVEEEDEQQRLHTSETPFEQEFEMPADVESIPLREEPAAAAEEETMFEDAGEPLSESAAEEVSVSEEEEPATAWDAPPATSPWDAESTAPSGRVSEVSSASAFGQDESSPLGEVETISEPDEVPESAATSSLWSMEEPESITPAPAAFTEPETLRMTPPAALAALPDMPAASSPASAFGSSSDASNLNASNLNDEMVDRIARRVIELMSEKVVRDVAWEVIPDLAEMVVKQRIRELENEA